MAFEFISMWKYDLRYEIFELQMWSWNELKCISRHDLIFFLNSKIWPNEDFPPVSKVKLRWKFKNKEIRPFAIRLYACFWSGLIVMHFIFLRLSRMELKSKTPLLLYPLPKYLPKHIRSLNMVPPIDKRFLTAQSWHTPDLTNVHFPVRMPPSCDIKETKKRKKCQFFFSTIVTHDPENSIKL